MLNAVETTTPQILDELAAAVERRPDDFHPDRYTISLAFRIWGHMMSLKDPALLSAKERAEMGAERFAEQAGLYWFVKAADWATVSEYCTMLVSLLAPLGRYLETYQAPSDFEASITPDTGVDLVPFFFDHLVDCSVFANEEFEAAAARSGEEVFDIYPSLRADWRTRLEAFSDEVSHGFEAEFLAP